MINRLGVLILSLLTSLGGFSQDTTNHNAIHGLAISGALIVGGLLVNHQDAKMDIRNWVKSNIGQSESKIDDIIQHLPIALLYSYDLIKGKDRATVSRQTRHLVVTQLLTLSSVHVAKSIFKIRRPNGGSRSFPSGHTAYAFASADVLYHSLKEDNLLLAYSGYLPAVAVGVYRVVRDKHWLSDVLVGAGMGILFSHLTYHLNIWNCQNKTTNGPATPVNITMGMVSNGVGLSVRF